MTDGLLQYYQRTVWYLRIMHDVAASQQRKAYWAAELKEAEDKMESAAFALQKAA